jgi:hypothetical protein
MTTRSKEPETDQHDKLLKRGYQYVKASDLRPMEWVQLPSFHLRAQEIIRSGNMVYVKFQADSVPVRWWRHNYRLRVNYPRPTLNP